MGEWETSEVPRKRGGGNAILLVATFASSNGSRVPTAYEMAVFRASQPSSREFGLGNRWVKMDSSGSVNRGAFFGRILSAPFFILVLASHFFLPIFVGHSGFSHIGITWTEQIRNVAQDFVPITQNFLLLINVDTFSIDTCQKQKE